ncbi:MAG TPA: MGMT family protein [Cryomorphaceae bacterium]|nr:MGMT family protein [Cryomorphaceae bacterium]
MAKSLKISEKNADFFEKVFMVVKQIPEGRVTSYGAIARYLGAGRSSRMVGWAMNVSHKQKAAIPAHRVVNRVGLLTGKNHFPTPFAMEEALNIEGIEIEDDQVVDFDNKFWDPSRELKID